MYKGRQAFSPRTSAKRVCRLRGRMFRALTRSCPADRRLLQLRRQPLQLQRSLRQLPLLRLRQVRRGSGRRQGHVRLHSLTRHRKTKLLPQEISGKTACDMKSHGSWYPLGLRQPLFAHPPIHSLPANLHGSASKFQAATMYCEPSVSFMR